MNTDIRNPPRKPRRRQTVHISQLDIARCPLCNGHLIARQGRTGPYWHCSC